MAMAHAVKHSNAYIALKMSASPELSDHQYVCTCAVLPLLCGPFSSGVRTLYKIILEVQHNCTASPFNHILRMPLVELVNTYAGQKWYYLLP
jgi:hypothetical protein